MVILWVNSRRCSHCDKPFRQRQYNSFMHSLIRSVCAQELELALEEERRAAEELRGNLTVLERKRIALQTELEDVRGLLEAVSLFSLLTRTVYCPYYTALIVRIVVPMYARNFFYVT